VRLSEILRGQRVVHETFGPGRVVLRLSQSVIIHLDGDRVITAEPSELRFDEAPIEIAFRAVPH
jgi:hypothetical protein